MTTIVHDTKNAPALVDDDVKADPIARFQRWWQAAHEHEREPAAVTLCSVDTDGRPSARVVLLRGVSDAGFTFFTNLESRKGRELRGQRVAALCFHWPVLRRQVRVEGDVVGVDDAEADAYFASRPRESQLGAWASHQSQAIASKDALAAQFDDVQARFDGKTVPRPPHWGGLRVVPLAIEFWAEGAHRLHSRERYQRRPDAWAVSLLSP